MAKDEEFARKLQNIIDKLSAISDRLEAGEGTAGKLLPIPRSTPMPIRCSSKPGAW